MADPSLSTATPPMTGKTWADLNLDESLLKAVAELGWRDPLDVQQRALPVLLTESAHLVAQAPTGKGKTGAFALGVLQKIFNTQNDPATKDNPLRAIIVAPTRELAVQIKTLQFDVLNKYSNFNILLATSNAFSREDTSVLTPDIAIGTPGTLRSLMKRRRLIVSNLRILVVDEADILIPKDSRSEVMGKLSLQQQVIQVREMCPPTASIWLFSATFSKASLMYARRIAKHAHEIVFQDDEQQRPVESVAQFVVHTNGSDEKFEVLKKFFELMDVGNVLIFCNRIVDVEYLFRRLVHEIGVTVGMHHSGIESEKRDENIEKFRQGEITVLVTTDVLGRGVDIPIVNFVVNYEPPTKDKAGNPDVKEFIHRVGRAGRVDRRGVALSFSKDQAEAKCLEAIFQSYPNFKVTTLEGAEDPDFVSEVVALKRLQ